MFTGIIVAVGRITSVKPLGEGSDAGLRMTVDAGGMPLDDVMLGDSIAINGACMTVVEKSASQFAFDVSKESLNRTAGLNRQGPVNLEKALTMADRLGGHLVSGHVDGIGTVAEFVQVGESWRLVVAAPRSLARFIAYKGSIVLNGVSLTVNEVRDEAEKCLFAINLIPHTLQATTLRFLKEGDLINLEIDLIARYVERMLSLSDSGGTSARNLARG